MCKITHLKHIKFLRAAKNNRGLCAPCAQSAYDTNGDLVFVSDFALFAEVFGTLRLAYAALAAIG